MNVSKVSAAGVFSGSKCIAPGLPQCPLATGASRCCVRAATASSPSPAAQGCDSLPLIHPPGLGKSFSFLCAHSVPARTEHQRPGSICCVSIKALELGSLHSARAVTPTHARGKAKLMFSLGELLSLSELVAARWVFAWCSPSCVGGDVPAQSRQRESLCWGC